jgi:beta-1,4-mannosyl-glycoprotein beta-1,4-N-acetylglucosaminyltransferase
MKLVDVFPYNGELIAELRLEYLSTVVDKFVLVEARHTHSGVRKEELFVEKNAPFFKKYNVEIVVIEEFPVMPDDWRPPNTQFMTSGSHESWFREQYQRQAGIDRALLTTEGPFVLICGDVDEIPRREVSNLKNMYDRLKEPVYLEMRMHYYNFNWVKQYNWHHAFAISDVGLKEVDVNEVRLRTDKKVFVNDAGWHLSYFGSIADMVRKLESFAHREFDRSEYKSKERVFWCIAYGKDLFDRETEHMVLRQTDDLPEGWQAYQKRLEAVHLLEMTAIP